MVENLHTVPKTPVWDPHRTNGWKLAHCPPSRNWPPYLTMPMAQDKCPLYKALPNVQIVYGTYLSFFCNNIIAYQFEEYLARIIKISELPKLISFFIIILIVKVIIMLCFPSSLSLVPIIFLFWFLTQK